MRSNLIRKIALMAVFALMASCAKQSSGWTQPLDRRFIADVAPMASPYDRSLQAYALTLPIFEMTEQADRIQWVSSSELRSETPDQLVLVGQGAQSSVAIQRISSIDSPEQRIRLTIGAQGGGPDPIYDLIRVPGGWRRTALREEEGAWDQIYQTSKTDLLKREAQQAGSSNGG